MRNASEFRYLVEHSPFGDFAVVWSESDGPARVRRVFLPVRGLRAEVEAHFPGAEPATDRVLAELSGKMAGFLAGRKVEFPLSQVSLGLCSRFQQSVLRAEHTIPRGRVSTYGAIAAHLGAPGSARAVGRALATNPFPIIVPCHRAVRGDGGLGGFQGGVQMKRALLELEGVRFSKEGKVVGPRFVFGSKRGIRS